MPTTLDQLLAQRSHRVTRGQQVSCFVFSFAVHAVLVAGLWFVPQLFAKPAEPFEYVSVMVVPPALLGLEEPPPPPPPKPPSPEPPDAVPEAVPEAAVVKPETKKPQRQPPPPPQAAPPPPAAVTPPPKRQGSPFGNPVGSKTSKAAVGVEDPTFTYGYYLDRVVALLSEKWIRPPVGSEVRQAVIYFRIRPDGTVFDVRLVESSTSERFDATALAAVEAASPLPPLPKSYKRDHLGINLIVK